MITFVEIINWEDTTHFKEIMLLEFSYSYGHLCLSHDIISIMRNYSKSLCHDQYANITPHKLRLVTSNKALHQDNIKACIKLCTSCSKCVMKIIKKRSRNFFMVDAFN